MAGAQKNLTPTKYVYEWPVYVGWWQIGGLFVRCQDFLIGVFGDYLACTPTKYTCKSPIFTTAERASNSQISTRFTTVQNRFSLFTKEKRQQKVSPRPLLQNLRSAREAGGYVQEGTVHTPPLCLPQATARQRPAESDYFFASLSIARAIVTLNY